MDQIALLSDIARESFDCETVELISSTQFDEYTLFKFRTVDFWPAIRCAIIQIGTDVIVCDSEFCVAEAVSRIVSSLSVEEMKRFIDEALPSHCVILDDLTPGTILDRLNTPWQPPLITSDSISLFVNDGGSEELVHWEIDRGTFKRTVVGKDGEEGATHLADSCSQVGNQVHSEDAVPPSR